MLELFEITCNFLHKQLIGTYLPTTRRILHFVYCHFFQELRWYNKVAKLSRFPSTSYLLVYFKSSSECCDYLMLCKIAKIIFLGGSVPDLAYTIEKYKPTTCSMLNFVSTNHHTTTIFFRLNNHDWQQMETGSARRTALAFTCF